MGIWSRLSNVINSYVNEMVGERPQERVFSRRYGDPDLDAAYDELNDFLNRDGSKERSNFERKTDFNTGSSSTNMPPEELRADFDCLGVTFGADMETCRTAYKKLVKIHHPDRHAGHEGNYKKATERSAKINAAYDRIEKYYNKGK
jgi:DnaJ-domain-containing protein 1